MEVIMNFAGLIFCFLIPGIIIGMMIGFGSETGRKKHRSR